MFLKGTSDLFRLNIASASNIKVKVWWGDALDGAPPAASDFDTTTFAAQTGTGNVTLLAGVAGHTRKPQASVFNTHASQATVVYLDMTDGTNPVEVAGSKVNLLAGESLVMLANEMCLHYDSNGGLYPSVGNAALQADMEAGTAPDKYVTPQDMKWHPGVIKGRGKFEVAGNTIQGWNVDSPTDNGTGDITVNFTTDFADASYTAQVTVEMTATTYAVANARTPHIRFGGQAAGTLRCDCIDGTTTTQLVKDPTAWHVEASGDFA